MGFEGGLDPAEVRCPPRTLDRIPRLQDAEVQLGQ
jgi:hypothetical protein